MAKTVAKTNLLLRITQHLPKLGAEINKDDIYIQDQTLKSWQDMVNILGELCDIPVAIIARSVPPQLDIICSSDPEGRQYSSGVKEPANGSFLGEVLNTRTKVQVRNARKEPGWRNGPDLKKGMVSFLGFPITWPNGDLFGVIGILDSRENPFRETYDRLLIIFKNLVESHIAMLYRRFRDIRSLEFILNNMAEGIIAHDLDRKILFFNETASQITGYSREEVLGRDCHKAMGGPFCGNKCSFCNRMPDFKDSKEYSINIVTKSGEPKHLEMTAMMMKGEHNQDIGILATFRDVTEVINLRLQTSQMNSFSNIVGRDSKMLSVFSQIRDVTDYHFPVHISGETGTGKELVARAIHNESLRGGAPFVPINCGALPEGLIESELFGHVKGAFSGAIREKKGRFELADTGTVFLDEIAELPKMLQVKLLRFLQEGKFEKVGGEKTKSVDVRIISATNKDLKREVQKGSFREDLYYRLNVIPIHIPPLRERKNDIPLLVEHFLQELPPSHSGTIPRFSNEALNSMLDYSWPGNVRELQNTVQFSLVRGRGKTIKPEALPMELRELTAIPVLKRGPSRKLNTDMVKNALEKTGGNKAKAARLLGVGRATLYRFLDEHADIA